MRYVVACIGAMILALALVFVVTASDLGMQKFFNPKYEQVRRETYEQSRAYEQGSLNNFAQYRVSWATADSAQKNALAPIIVKDMSKYGVDKLPSDFRSFYDQVSTWEGMH